MLLVFEEQRQFNFKFRALLSLGVNELREKTLRYCFPRQNKFNSYFKLGSRTFRFPSIYVYMCFYETIII